MITRRLLKILPAVLFIALAVCGAYAQGVQQGVQSQLSGGRSTRPTAARSGASLTQAPRDIEIAKIAPGYLLAVDVLDDQDYSGSFRVDVQGDIFIPYVNEVRVAGLTESQARAEVARVLREKGILINPQVVLTISEYSAAEVTILGEVNSPGKYPVLAPQPLSSVLGLAGGATTLAGSRITITSASSSAPVRTIAYSRTSPSADFSSEMIGPGDTVEVERTGVIFVLGAVNRPGGYVMQEGNKLSLLEAISFAAGTSQTASTSNLFVLRTAADGSATQIAVPYKKITNGKSGDVALRDSDIVFVPSSTLKAIFVDTQAIINSAITSTIYKTF